MEIVKKKMSELYVHLHGSDGRVALNGGYLYIYLNGSLLHIAGIPSPYLLADRLSDSTVENTDEFTDKDGNEFEIIIYSSNSGIEWDLCSHPDDEDLIFGLMYEVKLNDH